MPESFNPYLSWLQLEVNERPNHYDLLSLATYEADQNAIQEAADRAMSAVRSFRPGEHAKDWARLLDEISEAQTCLSNDDQKHAYDSQLRKDGVTATAPASTGVASSEVGKAYGDGKTNPLLPPGMGAELPDTNKDDGTSNKQQTPTSRSDQRAAPASLTDMNPPGFEQPKPVEPVKQTPAKSPAAPTQPPMVKPMTPTSGESAAGLPEVKPLTAAPVSTRPTQGGSEFDSPSAPAAAGPLPTSPTLQPTGGAPTTAGVPTTNLPPSNMAPGQMPSGPVPLANTGVPAQHPGAPIDPMAPAPLQGGPATPGVPHATAQPMSGVPMGGVPVAGVPTAGAPVTGVPTAGVPVAGVPTAGVPVTGVPTAGVPVAGVPMGTAAPIAGGSIPMGQVPAGNAIPVGTTASPASTGVGAPASAQAITPSAPKKSKTPVALIASIACVLLIGASGIMLWWASGGDPPAVVAEGDAQDESDRSNTPTGETAETTPGQEQTTTSPVTSPTTTPPNTIIPPITTPPINNIPPVPTDPTPPPPVETMMRSSAADVAAFNEALNTARLALEERNFDVVKAELAKANKLAKLRAEQEKVARFEQLLELVEVQFQAALDGSLNQLSSGSTINITVTVRGKKKVYIASFVEYSPRQLVLKVTGERRAYDRQNIPPEICLSAVTQWLDDHPANKAVRGAFIAATMPDEIDDARQLWQESLNGGTDIKSLMPILDDLVAMRKQ